MSDEYVPEQPVREPLAIVGIGCHYPGGATDPQAFWDLLTAGVDATSDVPEDRWEVRKFYDPDSTKSGKMNTFHGGFLERIDQFDAQFFGISPREAMWLDPQQRLLLRVAWEAMEDGGQVPDRLAGRDVGVFIGGFTLDYQLLQNSGIYGRYHLHTHSATGMMMTMLANRLSYAFDFRGPSLTVDTACSGSLVAVHLAAQSIWNGECTMALAGGVNLMISPNMTIAETKSGFLSPGGRCRTFDASADGYARGEGAGVVLVKPLAAALAAGDPVYALVRGSAVSQDGHTGGITVPSGAAQEVVMRTAYRRAGVAPHEVGYVEAHGTGTPLGDPIEATAIGTVLSTGRAADRACIVGSVKINIGHLEAAAGVAGLTKAALALRNGAIPPHLHLREPNPGIDFDALALRVPSELTEWPRTGTPRYAGINSFGFGGTNAHVVLQEPPPEPPPEPRAPEGALHYLLPLSARSEEALVAQARSHRDFLAGTDRLAGTTGHLQDIAYSAAQRRSHHDHRLTVTAASKAEAVEQMDAFLEDRGGRAVPSGRVAATGAPRIAFVCSGMGPQWWAMGRELLDQEPVFRDAVQRCDAELSQYTGWSLMDELTAPEDVSRMAATEVTQPANFAIQVGLAELWRSWGIEPDAVVGHSTGEVAAQYLTGALGFADAVKVTYYRSSLQQRTAGTGRMLAVGMTRETQEKAVREAGPLVSVAAINSPSAVTLSGDAAVLQDMAATAEKFGIFHRFLAVEVPYHSHLMDPLRDDLLAGLADLSPQEARIPLYSTVTGTRITGTGVGADYWWQNVRATVLFETAFTQMIADGYTTFVELSPHPVLTGSMQEILSLEGQEGLVVPSLRRGAPERAGMLTSLGTLYTRGCPVAWERFSDDASRFVRLPTYPWQLKTHWTESQEAVEDRHYVEVHPLLGQRLSATHPTWELEIGPARLPYLADHRIQDTVVLPGSAFVEMAVAAAREVYGEGADAVEDLAFRKALVLTGASDPRLRTVLDQERATVEFSSYTPSGTGEARWTVHATATLCQRRSGRTGADPGVPDGAAVIDREAFYRRTVEMGFQYGPAFRAVQDVRSGSGGAVGLVTVPDLLDGEIADYVFHPALLDSAFQVLLTAADTGAAQRTPYLPVGIDRVRILGRPTSQMQVVATVVHADDRLIVADIAMLDPDGRLLVEIEGFRAQSLETSMSLAPERIDRGLYELEWHAAPLPSEEDLTAEGPSAEDPPGEDRADRDRADRDRAVAGPADWLLLTDGTGVGAALAERLARAGDRVVTVAYGDVARLVDHGGDRFELDRSDPEQFRQLFAALAGRAPFARLVHLWSLDSEFVEDAPVADLDREQRRGVGSIVTLMQSLAQSGWAQLPRVWLVTRRAQAVGAHPGPVAVEQAPVWGLGRVIGHQEFTGIWGGLVDLDGGSPAAQAELLADEITSGSGEDQVAFRDGERHVARLVPSTALTPALPLSLRADGAYLVTGGLGSLGLLVARFLVARGARRLVLMGRTAVPDRSGWHTLGADHPQRGLVDELLDLERLGATVVTAAVDVADEEQLAGWLAAHEREARPPIRGVVHTAGVVSDELLLRMSTENFERVLAPKVRGGWLLHRVLADAPLDFFVLFSSTGSVIASLGQGNYAAGNAFLDALAQHRRGLGLPVISIGWGPWSVGMVSQLELERVYARRGIELITPEAGMQILARVMGQRPAHLTAITANWATARESSPHATLPPMFSLLGEQRDEPAADGAGPSLLALLRGAPAPERAGLLAAHLRDVAAMVLELDPDGLGEQEPLTGLGMDSMMAIEVKHRIEAAVQVEVSVLELLQGATVAGLADRLLSALSFAATPDAATPDAATPDAATPDGPGPDPVATDVGPSAEEIDRLIAETADADLERLLAELEREISQEGQR